LTFTNLEKESLFYARIISEYHDTISVPYIVIKMNVKCLIKFSNQTRIKIAPVRFNPRFTIPFR